MPYADVIIDQPGDPTDQYYTYEFEDPAITVGSLVTVPFARGNRTVSAVVFRVYKELEQNISNMKSIAGWEGVTLPSELLDTCLWMARRYLCRKNDALRLILPPNKPGRLPSVTLPYEEEWAEGEAVDFLTEEQEAVLGKMIPVIQRGEQASFLLHGVTGSGKTEVYMQLIQCCLDQEKQAIFLVPEIALTKQIIGRFIARFGVNQIAVFHSRLTPGQRYVEWMRIRTGQARIVIGARSGIFAPTEKVGLVILDEEHETTYKSDMTPKYETGEVALKRVMAQKGVLVLGSATPSITTMHRGEQGIYRLLELKERYNKVPLPEMSIVDMRQELKEGNRSIFSRLLQEKAEKCLAENKQIILFLNRRGYSNFVSCRECGYIMRCPTCGISLTYHRQKNQGICHYCGHRENVPKSCPDCGSRYLKYFGVGTEKVEEMARECFPRAAIRRLDLDTIKARGSMEKILGEFQSGETQILIGTQLVAKGLDFEGVGLVGIVSADVSLNIPDFRSAERTFQLITQAAGRAGRGKERGQVVIQSYTPEHYAIKYAVTGDYRGFYEKELALRKALEYPPFSDLIQVLFTATEEKTAARYAEKGETFLRKTLVTAYGAKEAGNLYPAAPSVIQRVGTAYRYQLVLKSPKERRRFYSEMVEEMKKNLGKRSKDQVTVSIDINPYSFI
jgi:primosomal protein N' (replication factor Y)